MTYPWQSTQADQIWQIRQQARLSHGLLFTGPVGTGKTAFAYDLAKSLLCENQQKVACGQCRSCKTYEADTHPDLHVIKPAETGKLIKVDDVRDLNHKLAQTSQFGGYTVAIIENAEQMNKNSANAILKTLEEPTENTVLILVTSYISHLLPTILSRCVKMQFPVPPRDQALAYLQQNKVDDAEMALRYAHGSPLLAEQSVADESFKTHKNMLKTLISVAEGDSLSRSVKELEKIPVTQVLEWFIDLTDDIISINMKSSSQRLVHLNLEQKITEMAQRTQVEKLFLFKDRLLERKRQGQIALNVQLLLEDLLILWQRAFKQV